MMSVLPSLYTVQNQGKITAGWAVRLVEWIIDVSCPVTFLTEVVTKLGYYRLQYLLVRVYGSLRLGEYNFYVPI